MNALIHADHDQIAAAISFLHTAPDGHELPHLFITGEAGHGKDTIGDYLIEHYGYDRMSISDGIREEIAAAYAQAPEPVTPEWQNDRDLKNVEQRRQALIYCSDKAFVKIALEAFEQEDKELFDRLKSQALARGEISHLDGLANRGGGISSLIIDPNNTSFGLETRRSLPRSPRRIQQVWGTEYRRSDDPDYWLKYAEKNADFLNPKVLTSTRYPNELEFGDRIGGVRFHVDRPGHREAAAHVTEQMLPLRDRDIVLINDGSVSDLLKKVDAVMGELCPGHTLRKRSGIATP